MKSDLTPIDATVSFASKTTYGGGLTTFVGWLSSSDVAIIAGLIATLGGFAVNLYFQRERNKREAAQHEMRQREHLERIAVMRAGKYDPPTR